MACCGRKPINITEEQQKLIDAIKKQQPQTQQVNTGSSGVKSNRSPAGSIARQCPNCGAKTIVPVCPICSFNLR